MNEKTTVLLVSQIPPPVHGSTIMTQVLIRTLGDLDFEPVLVDRRFSRDISEVGRISAAKMVASVGLAYRLISSVLRRRPRLVVYFMTTRGASFVVDFVLLELLKVLRVPVIGYLHTKGYRDLAQRGAVQRFMVRRSLASPKVVVTLSRPLSADIAPWVDASVTRFIANTPLEEPPVAVAPVSTAPILFLSNLIPEKGAAAFIHVALAIALRFPEQRFIVAGPSASDEYLDELRRLAGPLGERVEFVGRVEKSEKWKLLASAKMLVFPSVYPGEAQPLTLIESSASGTPVVAYEHAGVPDIVRHEVNGLLVPAGDEAALQSSVERLLDDPILLNRLSTGARAVFEEFFSQRSYEARWKTVLDEVLRPRGRQATRADPSPGDER